MAKQVIYPDVISVIRYVKLGRSIYGVNLDIYKPKPSKKNGVADVSTHWEISHFCNHSNGRLYSAETDIYLTEKIEQALREVHDFDPELLYYQLAI